MALRRPKATWLAALIALAALGAIDIAARNQQRSHEWSSQRDAARFLTGDEVTITGRVLRDSATRRRGESSSEIVDVESESVCVGPEPSHEAIRVRVGQGEAADPASALREDGPSLYEVQAEQRRDRGDADTASGAPAAAGECFPAALAMRVTVYPHEGDDERGGSVRKIQYGERLRFTTKLRAPRNFGNPGAWDYAGYLREQGIFALGAARADRVEALAPGKTSGWRAWRSRVRRSILARTEALWDERHAGLIAAMVVGDKSEIRRDTRQQFQRTGIYHILVVSGMNVGILAAVVFWCLKRLRIGQITASIVTVLLAIAYAVLTEAGAPIVRATLMLTIYLGARLLYRERAPLNAVGLAGLILLVADPRALFDASFQLTFLSVIAIAGIAVPLLERTSEPYQRALWHIDSTAYDLTLPPRVTQFRLDLRLLEGRLSALVGRFASRRLVLGGVRAALYAFELFTVSAIAQLALALPMAAYFHRAVLAGLPTNLLAVPLTGILMPAASAAVALAYVSPVLAKPGALIAAWSLDGIQWSMDFVGRWRAADWRVAAPGAPALAVCAMAVGACLLAARWKGEQKVPRLGLTSSLGMTGKLGMTEKLGMAGCLALLLVSAVLVVMPRQADVRPGILEITAIDVGQADSTLIVTPEGRTVLVDAAGPLGPFPSEFDFGEDVIAPYLWSRGIIRLDAVVLSHAHSDHMGGMRSIVANFRPRQLWLGANAPSPALDELLGEARQQEAEIAFRSGGEEFIFGAAEFRVLWPPRAWESKGKNRNDDSLVLRVSYGNTSALLAADADTRIERRMKAPPTTLLRVAHNGSATSTSPEFLDEVRPRYAAISVGARNQFRHPRPEVLARLAERGIATFRSDVQGATTFYLDGEKVTPRCRACPNR